MIPTRPPPRILFVHHSEPDPRHIKHLVDAGLVVGDVNANDVVAKTIAFQPDIIVLDFSANGEVTARLKGHDATKGIPIIALAALSDGGRRGGR